AQKDTEDLDFDLDLDLGDETSKKQVADDGLELTLDDSVSETSTKAHPSAADEALTPHAIAIPQRVPASGSIETEPEVAPPTAQKPATLRFILILLLLLMLMGAGIFGAVLYVQKNNITLPFIGKTTVSTQPEFHDPGNLRIRKSAVTHSFINHEEAGRLLIITGQVHNNYPQPRKHIHIRAKLFAGETLSATRMVYAGNTLPEIELMRMPLTEIEKELNKISGDRNLNENIGPAQTIPFMFVFSDLPQGLSGFEIDVMRSSPADRK
ncbi:DUF3426 domain-containing protein, partial [Desulfobotulus alkaliphilus]|uniref:DUF3426 domain-containing protein n=1 Tax=Desulfobotulus alkaliphilus TaxID=622671 RepID=UPI00119FB293